MEERHIPSPAAARLLSPEALREHFLVGGLFESGVIKMRYTGLDRMILGSAVPNEVPLALPADKRTGTDTFLERREIGILNLGQSGVVRVDGTDYHLESLDCLYVGLGARSLEFVGQTEGGSRFYFVSTPAHAAHPTALLRRAEAGSDELGAAESSNRRRLTKYIHPGGLQSCQLMLGFTELQSGSVWNTMPPHLHSRRSEAYLYFGLDDEIVVHLMGEPEATRHLIVRNEEAVLSPPWSIHCGAGTGNYGFVWAMAGENQSFADMDAVAMADLR